MNPLRLRVKTSFSFQRLPHCALLFFWFAAALSAQARWSAVGPVGGDARALAAVPGAEDHLYLGSTNSWIYESLDQGAHWQRLAKLDATDDLIIDHIVVDPADHATLYAAAWKLDAVGGGLWITHDGGRHWAESQGLRGQSIRAFAQAVTDPKLLFAGTLDGVFRSADAGATWSQISPPTSREIHNIESLAVDPADPNILYAGTWHLPWKTTDGGKSWHSIKNGLIEDSDVFSIVIDPQHSRTVFLSACSGIYKSESAGELFHKIQGIPSSARRTRVLRQDIAHREIVYAGTTEGLYKTLDGGHTFQPMTGPEVIVNDVFVDPRNPERVLLATDRGGVLVSSDAGASFIAANEGFSGRKVEALLVDRAHPTRLYAGLVNDKSFGGVFVSSDSGAHWAQISAGLDSLDVFALAQSADGSILAGTSHGIFALESGDNPNSATSASPNHWFPRNIIANTQEKTATETHMGVRVNVAKQVKEPERTLESRVTALELSGEAWVAATTGGLFTSRDHGATWQGGPVMGAVDYLSVAAQGRTLAAAHPDGVALSTDNGRSWMPMGTPAMLTRIHRVAFSADGTLWLAAREGVYFTRDLGKTWLWFDRLTLRDVDDLSFDAQRNRMMVSSRSSDLVYSIDPKSSTWTWAQTGYRIALVRSAAGRMVAASLFDGVLIEPPTVP